MLSVNAIDISLLKSLKLALNPRMNIQKFARVLRGKRLSTNFKKIHYEFYDVAHYISSPQFTQQRQQRISFQKKTKNKFQVALWSKLGLILMIV